VNEAGKYKQSKTGVQWKIYESVFLKTPGTKRSWERNGKVQTIQDLGTMENLRKFLFKNPGTKRSWERNGKVQTTQDLGTMENLRKCLFKNPENCTVSTQQQKKLVTCTRKHKHRVIQESKEQHKKA
jgi:hypothetical protein